MYNRCTFIKLLHVQSALQVHCRVLPLGSFQKDPNDFKQITKLTDTCETNTKRRRSRKMDTRQNLKQKSRLLLGLVESPANLKTTKLVYFFGPSFKDSRAFELSDAKYILKHYKFDINKKTVLYLHGYLEDLEENSVFAIVSSYLNRYDHNIIVLDWKDLAEGNYFLDAVENIKQLGPVIAKTLLSMTNSGFNIEKLHIVGHSLGGQLAGVIGREVIANSSGTIKIPRITALDPAFPTFYIVKFAKPLSKKDAHFVDVIHTDAWFYGSPFSTGTADFWPNGGKGLQPGCPPRNHVMLSDNDLCSHRRSWLYWVESVAGRYENKFNAVKAKSWSQFKAGNADKLSEVVMGLNCPTNISGNFYLQTNGCPPFAKGKPGTIYT